MTDFHETLATVHAGECPFCGGALRNWSNETDELVVGNLDGSPIEQRLEGLAWCDTCDVGFRVQHVHDPAPENGMLIGMGPQLWISRDLTDAERRKLYVRS